MKAFLISMLFILSGHLSAKAQSEIYTSLEVDEFPVIEKCEEENSNCFQESLKTYIQKNIDIKSLTKYTSAKAYAQFVVMASGEIKDIKVRTTNKDLEKVAIKLLNDLKIESPAMLNAAAVNMVYTTPISFSSMSINAGSYDPTNDILGNKRPELAFNEAAKLPLYKECKSSGNDSCFEELTTKRIISFLKSSKNLKVELKEGMELKVYFEIQTDGEIINAMVVCNSNKIMKELPLLINKMKVFESAKDKNNNPVATFFMKTIVI